jgi:caa(3)-type oxidase subunit IV
MAHHEEEHHVLPLTHYFGVYAGLLVLTVVTVLVSLADLGPLALPVAMFVAVIKAGCVAAIFMHLAYDNKFLLMIFIGSLLFLFLFFVFTMFDLGTRGRVYVEHDNKYRVKQKLAMAGLKGDVKVHHHDVYEKSPFPKSTFLPKALRSKLAAAAPKKAGPTPAILRRGRALFMQHCQACHTAQGVGNKALKTPNWTKGEWRFGGTFKSTYKIITNGSPKNATMVAWKGVVPAKKDREALAWYVLQFDPKKRK